MAQLLKLLFQRALRVRFLRVRIHARRTRKRSAHPCACWVYQAANIEISLSELVQG